VTGKPKKHRLLPPIGTHKLVQSRLAQNFTSRRARWDQIQLPTSAMTQAAYLDFAELARYGYPFHVVLRAWHASRGHDRGFLIGLHVLYKNQNIFCKPANPWMLTPATYQVLQHIRGLDVASYPYDVYDGRGDHGLAPCTHAPALFATWV